MILIAFLLLNKKIFLFIGLSIRNIYYLSKINISLQGLVIKIHLILFTNFNFLEIYEFYIIIQVLANSL